MGTAVDAHWGRLGQGTAVIEMAAASGLHWVPREQRDARLASSYGTGELIRQALDAGATRIILGLGGSATTDGGVGPPGAHENRPTFAYQSGPSICAARCR